MKTVLVALVNIHDEVEKKSGVAIEGDGIFDDNDVFYNGGFDANGVCYGCEVDSDGHFFLEGTYRKSKYKVGETYPEVI